jgi:rhodanese-related sulfurtransferase
VVVYCKGGDCEDSIFLARDLAYKYDVAIDSLYIYEGGMNDWQQRNLATTSGEQR